MVEGGGAWPVIKFNGIGPDIYLEIHPGVGLSYETYSSRRHKYSYLHFLAFGQICGSYI